MKNIAGNDLSTISDLITGPSRAEAAKSFLQGKALNTIIRGVGMIPTATGLSVAQNSAGDWHAVADVVTQRISGTAAGKLAGVALGTASQIKFYYDVATYAGSLAACVVE